VQIEGKNFKGKKFPVYPSNDRAKLSQLYN